MSWVAVGVAGATLVGGIYSSNQAGKAANSASNAQQASAQAGIAEQQRQFDAVQKLLAPYVTAGTGALGAQQDMLGVGPNGAAGQQQAIAALQASPYFTAMKAQGENSILANASATGGLRGGNTQGALAQFTPALLAQAFQQQYSNLGGLTSIGQNAAAGVGNAGLSTGQGISSLLQQQGAAQAGGYLAQGQANTGYASSLAGAAGAFGALYRPGAAQVPTVDLGQFSYGGGGF